jgi:hypothetical protein
MKLGHGIRTKGKLYHSVTERERERERHRGRVCVFCVRLIGIVTSSHGGETRRLTDQSSAARCAAPVRCVALSSTPPPFSVLPFQAQRLLTTDSWFVLAPPTFSPPIVIHSDTHRVRLITGSSIFGCPRGLFIGASPCSSHVISAACSSMHHAV